MRIPVISDRETPVAEAAAASIPASSVTDIENLTSTNMLIRPD